MMQLGKYLKIERIFIWMLLFIPLSMYFAWFTNNKTILFITSILAIIPLARILGFATKEITLQTNPTIGGLLSATFGNAIELMIAILALREGLIIVVQASIIGSIIGNILLLMGVAIFFGGLRYKKQIFNKQAIGVSSTMLIIAVAGLTIPTMYSFASSNTEHAQTISYAVAIILALIYIAGLIFSLLTHKDLFDASDEIKATKEKPMLSKKTAAIFLVITTAIVALESEFLVSGIKDAAINIGFTETFIGIVLIAILTNIAETISAVNFARENKLDISFQIGLSSAIQIALFVVPILVIISQIFNYHFNLVFPIFGVITMFLAVTILNHLAADGICNWLEGAQLITMYLIIATVFFFIV